MSQGISFSNVFPGDAADFSGESILRATALLNALCCLLSSFFLQPFSSPNLPLSLNKKKALSQGLELLPVNKVHGALNYSLAEADFAFLVGVCVLSN